MQRIVILGRGGAGKTSFAHRLGEYLALPVVELDEHLWLPDQPPLPREAWEAVLRELVRPPRWVMEGDLGRFDALPIRLAAADTVVILDPPLWRCLGRALRRGLEGGWYFWYWLLTWGRSERPRIDAMIADQPTLHVHVLRSSEDLNRFLDSASGG